MLMNTNRKHQQCFASRLGSNQEQGFSLIEAMVALVVISVGLMGVASMLAVAVGNTGVARTRGIAGMLATSLSASMSANRAYWASAVPPSTMFSISNTTITGAAALNSASTNCASATCTAEQMASYDLKQWAGSASGGLAAQLPNGTGEITCAAAIPRVCTVSVKWSEKDLKLRGGSGHTVQTYVMVVQP